MIGLGWLLYTLGGVWLFYLAMSALADSNIWWTIEWTVRRRRIRNAMNVAWAINGAAMIIIGVHGMVSLL